MLLNGAPNNLIGGTAVGAGNLISGNQSNGIWVFGTGSVGNQIQGNLIGTNVSGTAALPNSASGVDVDAGATNTLVGGTTAGAGNVLSGNGNHGVLIQSNNTTNTTVQGNYIGTNFNGTAALANQQNGILITGNNNTVGGNTAGARNIISGNNQSGVRIELASGNSVQGNYLGTDVNGTAALGNGHSGVYVTGNNNTIGGVAAGTGNILSGNSLSGIWFTDSSCVGNLVQGNFIGTNASGSAALPNSFDGITVGNLANNNTFGGSAPEARNILSGNGSWGIELNQTSGNTIAGNFIGTDVSGTVAVGNGSEVIVYSMN